MVMLGFKPYSPVKVIDTMLVSKKHFNFTSNKLAWLSTHLTNAKKSEHKLFPGFELWAECLKDNPQAWAEMKKYNCIDTEATEELYLKLRPWIVGHVNVAAYNDLEEAQCPKCGSSQVQTRGSAYTQTGQYHRIHCTNCGGWSRTRYTENTSDKRKSLLSN
jgi:RNase P subunit RPR2